MKIAYQVTTLNYAPEAILSYYMEPFNAHAETQTRYSIQPFS